MQFLSQIPFTALPTLVTAIRHTLARLDMTVQLAFRWYCMLLVAFLESFPLLQEVSGILAALILEASLVTTLLGTAALCYNIYSFSGDSLWS